MHLFLQTLYMLTVMIGTSFLMLFILLITPDVHDRLATGIYRPPVQKAALLSGYDDLAPSSGGGSKDTFGKVKAVTKPKEMIWSYSGNNEGYLKQVPDYERPERALWGAVEGACSSYSVRYAKRSTLPKTALASYPGSGNTWLRYLIEGSTGIFTGSLYTDKTLADKGFYGEGASPECGCTIVVKTHGYCLMGTVVDRKIRFQDQDRFQRRAVFLIRNPYDALIAYRNFQMSGGHTGVSSSSEAFTGENWNNFVRNHILIWRTYAMDWLLYGRKITVVHFELLKTNLTAELTDIVEFLKIRSDPKRIACAVEHKEGNFRRHTPSTAFYRKNDPFTKTHHEVIDSAVYDINKVLQRRGFRAMPIELYNYIDRTRFTTPKIESSTVAPTSKSDEKTKRRFSKLIYKKNDG